MISPSQKHEAWRWLAQQALAGNAHATVVLVDWSGSDNAPSRDIGAYTESLEALEVMAVTFQYWIDQDDRRVTRGLNGVIPPKYPTFELVCSWLNVLEKASEPFDGMPYAQRLQAIRLTMREWIDYVVRCHQKDNTAPNSNSPVMVPLWPTRAKLHEWIRALKADPFK